MKPLALALAFCVGTAALGHPSEPAQATATTPDVVEVAKAAKEKKKKSTTKVITNADVKKAKARVGETKIVAPVEPAPKKSLAEEYETSYRDRLVNDEKVAVTRKKVADLERELAAVEQSYYEENDLDKRDTEIVKRFNDTKAKLEQARKDLAALAPPAE
jgi:membrane-bound lytic murein transglycosylase B